MSRLFNPTVAAITLRSALGRRRAFLLAIPPAILLLVTLALKASHPSAPSSRSADERTRNTCGLLVISRRIAR